MQGGSHPEELVEYAADLGYTHIAITDSNSMAGVVRAHQVAKLKNIKFIPACRLDFMDGPSLLAYPTDIAAWGLLCTLLTKGNLRTEKGKCELYSQDVYKHKQGVKFIVIPPAKLNSHFDFDDDFKTCLEEYRLQLGSELYMAASFLYTGDDAKRFYRLSQLGVPMVATNNVYYHHPLRRELQDVQTCVREKCTIGNAGFKLHVNAERYLKPVDELERLYRKYPDAISLTNEIAEACHFSLDE
jgi:error-prone DNA polymerase